MKAITAEDIWEAFTRWNDFARVQGGAEGMSREQREQKLVELVAGEGQGVSPEAIAGLTLSVGIADDARRAFWAAVDNYTEHVILQPEHVITYAAFMGLIVGLMARQIAEERRAR
jgi:hypothetical protein